MHKRIKPLTDRIEVVIITAIALIALIGIIRFVILADIF
jgi:hypothetical protein